MQDEQEYIRETLPEIAKDISNKLPENYGFCTLVFQFGDGPNRRMSYVSNANRQDIGRAMIEWLQATEGNKFGKHI